MGHPFGFIADANALLPLMHFIEGASVLKEQSVGCPCRLCPASVRPGKGVALLELPGSSNNRFDKHSANLDCGGRTGIGTPTPQADNLVL